MTAGWWSGIARDDRDFLVTLGACTLAYGFALWGLSFVPTPTRSTTDVTSLPPRIAKLIMEAPLPPRATLAPPSLPAEPAAPIKTNPEPKPRKGPTKREPTPETQAPPPEPPPLSEAELQARAETAMQEARIRMEAEAAARREQARAVASQSGLLKALAESSGGGGVGQAPALDRVLGDVSVLSNPALPQSGSAGAGAGLGTGTGEGLGSGSGGTRLSVDQLVAGLKGDGTGEAVVLGGRSTAPVASSLDVLRDLEVNRSASSIQKVMKSLDPWLKLKYHAALRDHPTLGDYLSVGFTITANGDIVDCQVQESRLGYPPLEDVILKRICLLKFPPLTGGVGQDVTAVHPIDFTGFR